jgi:hypothetical protein
VRCEKNVYRPEPPSIATCISRVNEMGLAKTSAASILQRLLGSSPTSERHRRSLAISRLLTIGDATACKTIVAAHRCLPRLRREREAKHQ